jgi:putative membrane protein
MIVVGNVLAGIVALIHVYIVVLEMVLWTKPQGRKTFGLTPEFAEQTKTLGLNQGLYNGFLAAGLIAGLIAGGDTGFAAKVFFLICVAVAGVVGALTASRRILYVQTVPAALALVFVLLGH